MNAARRDFGRAFRLAVYSYTPFWLAGVFLLAPGLRFLVVLSAYGVYLLWKGLPCMMGTPGKRATAFTAVVVGTPVCFEVIPAVFKHHNTYCSYADTIMPGFFFAVGFAFRLTLLRRRRSAGTYARTAGKAERQERNDDKKPPLHRSSRKLVRARPVKTCRSGR